MADRPTRSDTAATLVHSLLAQESSRPAIHQSGRTTTFGTLQAASDHLAGRLRDECGVCAGDRVAMLAEPGPGFVALVYGIWRAGAAAVVLSPLHPANERSRLLDDARPRALVASPALAATLRESAGERFVWVVAEADLTGDPRPSPRVDAAAAAPLATADDPALLVYTSGTTSAPKGVVLRHRQLTAQCAAIAEAWGMSHADRLVHALPLHHVHGLVIALLTVLDAGGSADMLPGFDAGAVLAACDDATVLMGVPTMYARLVDALDALDDEERRRAAAVLASLRLCTSGSAGLSVSLGERWARHAGAYPVERFGMTELGVALSNPVAGERVPGSVGYPLPGVRVRVHPDGPDADEGELLVAGPTVFDTYHERPTETAAAFLFEDGVRWFRTGDTVRMGADGSVRILGRTSVDILKSAGYKLSAPEIEEAVRRHPAVRDAAVVGLPHETYGHLVAAAVVCVPGADLTSDALLTFLRAELAAYKLPRLVRFVDDLPRNALGKVLKPELTRRLEGEIER